ncbi:MAG TPA: hypothetical protein VFI29_13615 [Hanamia sp.]|nr:hypothetical protein [Hanamia sp.]
MNKKVNSGNPVPAKSPYTATPKTNFVKTATPAANKMQIKTDADQQKLVQSLATSGEETSNEFSVWRSTRQIIDEFPVCEKSLYNWRQAGILPHGLLGSKIMYNRTLIEKILKSRWNAGLVLMHFFLDLLPIC